MNRRSSGLSLLSTFLSPGREPMVVGVITLLAAFLRVLYLGDKPLWNDEAMLYWASSGTFLQTLTHSGETVGAPPLFMLLLNLLIPMGRSEALLRSAACLAGIISLPFLYILGRRFLSREGALFCLALAALSSTQVYYAQQVREYTLTFLLANLLLLLFDRFLERPGALNTILLSVVMVLSLFTQYGLALLVLSFQPIFFSFWRPGRDGWMPLRRWILIHLPSLAALPVIWSISLKYKIRTAVVQHFLDSAFWDGSLKHLPIWTVRSTMSLIDFAFRAERIFPLVILALFLLAIRVRPSRRLSLFFAAPILVGLLAGLGHLYPFHGIRQDIFLTPMIYVMAGWGFEKILLSRHRWLAPALWVLLMTLGTVATARELADPGDELLPKVTRGLKRQLEPTDRIYVYYGAVPVFRFYFQDTKEGWINGTPCQDHVELSFDQLDKLVSGQGRIWMVFSHEWGHEMRDMVDHVSEKREVVLVSGEGYSHLYLARERKEPDR